MFHAGSSSCLLIDRVPQESRGRHRALPSVMVSGGRKRTRTSFAVEYRAGPLLRAGRSATAVARPCPPEGARAEHHAACRGPTRRSAILRQLLRQNTRPSPAQSLRKSRLLDARETTASAPAHTTGFAAEGGAVQAGGKNVRQLFARTGRRRSAARRQGPLAPVDYVRLNARSAGS